MTFLLEIIVKGELYRFAIDEFIVGSKRLLHGYLV